MELIIEIGTDEQKILINKELSFFIKIIEKINLSINILKIVVANDFDKTVNQFQRTSNYKSNRGLNSNSVTAMAKIIDIEGGYVIVLSQLLFMEWNDSQTRYFVYLHELCHAINKQKMPCLSKESMTLYTYNYNIYYLYDEYYCDRFSYSLIEDFFLDSSELWNIFLKNELNGFSAIINDQQYYDHLTDDILRFRFRRINVENYLENAKPVFDTISITIAHTYALIDQYPDLSKPGIFNDSHFINNNTFELMNYFKMKYEKNTFDLEDGFDLIIKFMTNYGMQFEDTDRGLYCHILDI